MNLVNNNFVLSASDLSNHIACNHLSFLNMALANEEIDAPKYRDPMLALLQERGQEFEDMHLNTLREHRKDLVVIPSEDNGSAFERTLSAMKAGSDVIYQATLQSGQWTGRADFLERVERPSALGNCSYEVVDSKLDRKSTRLNSSHVK